MFLLSIFVTPGELTASSIGPARLTGRVERESGLGDCVPGHGCQLILAHSVLDAAEADVWTDADRVPEMIPGLFESKKKIKKLKMANCWLLRWLSLVLS